MNTRRWLIACVALMAFCTSVNAAEAAKYTATAWLMVKSRPPVIHSQSQQPFSEKEFEIYKKTQMLLLKSQFVLMAALRKPGIVEIPDVDMARREGDALRWLGEQIKVTFPNDAEIMSVSCTRHNPDEAQTLVTAVVDAYMEEVVNAERDSRMQSISELERQCMSLENKLRTKMEIYIKLFPDIQDGKEKEKPFRPTVDMQMLQLEIKTLEKEVSQLQVELDRQRIEARAAPRITSLGAVLKPIMPD